MSLITAYASISLSSGSPVAEHAVCSERSSLTRVSCQLCSSPLYYFVNQGTAGESVRMPELVAIKAGILEDKARFSPVAHLWTKRKQPWLKLGDDIPQFEEQPAFKTLVCLWKEAHPED